MFFMYEQQVVLRAFVRIHVFGQDLMPAGLDNRFFVIAPNMCGTERAYAISFDFSDYIPVSAVRPVGGIFEIDE